MFLKTLSGKLGILFFARLRRFFLGAAGESVETFSSSSSCAAFFFLRLFFFGAVADASEADAALPFFFFFHDALALFRLSLKLVDPLA